MAHRYFPLLGLACVLLCNPVARADDNERVFGSWTLRCQAQATSGVGCVMLQNLVLKTGGQPVLQFAIGMTAPDTPPAVLISLPLGIALPPGVTIQIDDGKPATFPVERCEPDGCRAGVKLRDSTIAQLRAGKRLHITFFDGSRAPIKVPLSLEGFTDAFAALHGPAS